MSNNIVIVDYGVGNLHSVGKALEKVGGNITISSNPKELIAADKIVLPGVGAFGDCMENLRKYELIETVQQLLKSAKPFLGICVGMQILFESSEESPGIAGLGFFAGKVCKITGNNLKVPHIGWNTILAANPGYLLENAVNQYVYFVHSYYAQPRNPEIITSYVEYGSKLTASVAKDNVQALQFHPEKSSNIGLKILKNFVDKYIE